MIYTIDEIREKVQPIAEKYHLSKVYLFGSYARGGADEESDIDLAVDDAENQYYLVYNEYRDVFENNVDVLSLSTLLSPETNIGELVKRNFLKESVLLYER